MLGLYRAGRQAEALEGLRRDPAGARRARARAGRRAACAPGSDPAPGRHARRRAGGGAAASAPARAGDAVRRPPGRGRFGQEPAARRHPARDVDGSGGAGKTRVALRAAHELADAFADGVWFVGLAALVDPALVRPAIAQALGHAEETLADELHDRELLLVLDNFEQLLDAARVVGSCCRPRRACACSRRAARGSTCTASTSTRYRRCPPPTRGALRRPRAATGRALPPGSLVTEICRRLDGLPLAIELVAARTAELTPAELMSSLDDSLELASKGARDLPERQRTLRAAIGWSHDLLDPDQQRLFAHLGAFAGGFTRDAVQAVCGEDAAEHLAGLAEASLVRRADDGRYRMLQTIREYAVERLSSPARPPRSGAATRSTFASWARSSLLALPSEAVDEVYATFEREHDNYRAALAFAGETESTELRFRLAAAVSHFWLVRGHLAEGRAWLEETLALAPAQEMPPLLRAQVLRKLATLEWRQGDFEIAGERAEAALPLLAGEVDEDERYRLLILLGCIEYSRRNREGRATGGSRARRSRGRLENEAHLALALSNLGVVAAELQDYEGGVAIYEESVESALRAEHREYLAGALLGLGDMNLRLGRYEAGRAQMTESIALYRRLGFHDRIASCCVWLAPAPEHDGDLALRGAAARRGGGDPPADRRVGRLAGAGVPRRARRAVAACLGDAAYDEAFAAGEAAPDAVVQEVLASAAAAAPVAGQDVRPGG